MSSTPPDLAERRRSSAAHVRAILDNTLDAVVAMDADGVIRFWNPRAEETFGWEAERRRRPPAGRSWWWTRRTAERLGEELDRLARPTAAGRCRTEVTGRRRDGAAFPLEITVTRIPEDPDYRFSAFARDITERKRSERERERLLVEAEHAREQAEAASRVKDEFLSTLSHELRTPLTAIVGWIYLLRGGRLDEAARTRALDAIDRNAGAQAQVISDILDLSRIVGARFKLSVRPIQLAPVVAAAIETLMPAANARGITVQTNLDPSAGLVSGDTDRLRQVVWNLLSNAIKFTPQGGRVTVRVERADPNVVVVVEDTGVGISPHFLPHVFERFRQADSSNTRNHGGLGLGLAVVRHLVELHGGQVTADSPGEGDGASSRSPSRSSTRSRPPPVTGTRPRWPARSCPTTRRGWTACASSWWTAARGARGGVADPQAERRRGGHRDVGGGGDDLRRAARARRAGQRDRHGGRDGLLAHPQGARPAPGRGRRGAGGGADVLFADRGPRARAAVGVPDAHGQAIQPAELLAVVASLADLNRRR